jgi:hypothetical protein
MYVEYKGRASEWYSLEVAKMMNWMSRKKRYSPMKEIGAQGVEFKSTRPTDNRFYWLRGDNFTVNTQYDHREEKWPGTFRPATFQVTLTVGNKSEKGAAKIWNQLLIRTHGMKSATLLITPGMMDLKYPLAITLNSQPGRMRVIEPSVETMVDELLQTGDRQRPVIAKVDLRP